MVIGCGPHTYNMVAESWLLFATICMIQMEEIEN